MNITITIPTYNEADNIKKLIPFLSEEFKKLPEHNFTVMVVDGNSPDGTSELVKKLSSKYSFLKLLPENEKAGLGAAYIYAFKHILKNMPDTEAVIEMDGDLQHDPKDLKKLTDALSAGHAYVIGSRFIEGGSIPKDWALYRKILSWGGNLFSKVVLWIWNVNDFTSGYKATKRELLERMDLDNVLSKGFAYKIHLLYQAHKLGADIKEVPISFGLRDGGASKMEKNNFSDSMKVVLSIRAKESQSFLKFVVAGFAGLFTDAGLFNVLRLVALPSDYSSAVSGFIAMIVTYSINNFWSFSQNKRTSVAGLIKAFIPYAFFSYIPIIFRSWLISYATSAFSDNIIVANLAFFVGVAIGLVWNFTVYSKIIWRKKAAAR